MVKDEALPGTQFDAAFLEVGGIVSREALAGAAVEGHLCNDALKSRRKRAPPGGG